MYSKHTIGYLDSTVRCVVQVWNTPWYRVLWDKAKQLGEKQHGEHAEPGHEQYAAAAAAYRQAAEAVLNEAGRSSSSSTAATADQAGGFDTASEAPVVSRDDSHSIADSAMTLTDALQEGYGTPEADSGSLSAQTSLGGRSTDTPYERYTLTTYGRGGGGGGAGGGAPNSQQVGAGSGRRHILAGDDSPSTSRGHGPGPVRNRTGDDSPSRSRGHAPDAPPRQTSSSAAALQASVVLSSSGRFLDRQDSASMPGGVSFGGASAAAGAGVRTSPDNEDDDGRSDVDSDNIMLRGGSSGGAARQHHHPVERQPAADTQLELPPREDSAHSRTGWIRPQQTQPQQHEQGEQAGRVPVELSRPRSTSAPGVVAVVPVQRHAAMHGASAQEPSLQTSMSDLLSQARAVLHSQSGQVAGTSLHTAVSLPDTYHTLASELQDPDTLAQARAAVLGEAVVGGLVGSPTRYVTLRGAQGSPPCAANDTAGALAASLSGGNTRITSRDNVMDSPRECAATRQHGSSSTDVDLHELD